MITESKKRQIEKKVEEIRKLCVDSVKSKESPYIALGRIQNKCDYILNLH